MKAICLLLLVCFTNLFASTTFLRSEKILLHTEGADYKQGDTLRFFGSLLEATTTMLLTSSWAGYIRTKDYKKAEAKSEGTVYVPIGLSDI